MTEPLPRRTPGVSRRKAARTRSAARIAEL